MNRKCSPPKELMPQITPWTKILCSYKAINAPAPACQVVSLKSMLVDAENKDNQPSVEGVKRGKIMLLLGLFPSKTLLLTRASLALAPSSFLTCSSVLPKARASGCAKKLLSRIR
jgi:hypothetical protein